MKFSTLFVVLMVGSLVLSACGAASTPASSYGSSNSATSTPAVVPPTSAPATDVPTIAPATDIPAATSTTEVPAAPAGPETKVKISSFAFNPSKLQIKVGTTVTWTNEDGASHTVSADDGSFSSDTLQQGDSNAFTFNEAGSYSYHCDFHSGMKATITVTP